MTYLAPLLTALFALGTVLSRKTVTASFFFLLSCCGVAACLFNLGLAPFTLILLFSSSFWLVVYFLFSTLLSKEMKATPLLDKKHRLMASGLALLSFLVLAAIYVGSTYQTENLPLKSEDLIEFWRVDFVQNFPFLLTYSLFLISSLIATLFITWNPPQSGGLNERL